MDIYLLGARSNKFFINFSLQNSLGHIENKDFNNPVCVEDLCSYKVIDVGCGSEYMIVLAYKANSPIQHKILLDFNDKVVSNARHTIETLKNS